ncbi:MAG TPA: Fe-S cluster assembly protein HesB [Patescibacteria group bacterium]|nr:Fe-S cluster assembly protein HesB [Patescibacteria group bacterium]
MVITQRRVKAFQKKILQWYEINQRDLPWRQTRDPYNILISEVMSQQTQLSRVIPKYEAWLKRFPTLESLASAKTTEVLRLWSGLGYNRRALNLKKAALMILFEYKGRFPSRVIELEQLPGIGVYTASAIACFAFAAQIPVIDTNIRKVIAHEFFQGILPNEKKIKEVAEKILPKGHAYTWNQALMDYSAVALKDKKIPVPKQSPFVTSNRYYRGETLKLLLEVGKISLPGLVDYFAKRNRIESIRLTEILQQMQKDGLVILEGRYYRLPNS